VVLHLSGPINPDPWVIFQFWANYSSLFPHSDPVKVQITMGKPKRIHTLRLVAWVKCEEPTSLQLLSSKDVTFKCHSSLFVIFCHYSKVIVTKVPLLLLLLLLYHHHHHHSFYHFLQGIYNNIPETNHVSRVYSVAAVLYLQFVQHVILFHS